jgi:hypothetical protein
MDVRNIKTIFSFIASKPTTTPKKPNEMNAQSHHPKRSRRDKNAS